MVAASWRAINIASLFGARLDTICVASVTNQNQTKVCIWQIFSPVILKFKLLCLHQLNNQPSICCVYIVLYVHWRGGGGIDLAKATKQPCEATSSSIYCCTKAIVRYWFATAACYRAARAAAVRRARAAVGRRAGASTWRCMLHY